MSLYYSLLALEKRHPEMWKNVEPQFFCDWINLGVKAKNQGRRFLIDLSARQEFFILVKGKPDFEFLYTALLHYVTIKLGHWDSALQAWEQWEKYRSSYPTLVEIFHRQLHGEDTNIIEMNSTELEKQYIEKKEELHTRVEQASPIKYRGYKGVSLAHFIQGWYVDEYIQPIQKILDNDRLSKKGSKSLAVVDQWIKQLRDVLEHDDLVDRCPLQHSPPATSMRPIMYPFEREAQ